MDAALPDDCRVGSYEGHVYCATELRADDALLVQKTIDAAYALLAAVDQVVKSNVLMPASQHHNLMLATAGSVLRLYHNRLERRGKHAVASGAMPRPDCSGCHTHESTLLSHRPAVDGDSRRGP